MPDTTIPPIALAPKSIRVQGPDRGRYNLLSSEETDRYIVTVDGVICSTTVPIEISEQIEGYAWPDLIEAIVTEAAKWISGSDITARRAAVTEWIRRDDPDEERLEAIEAAELEVRAQRLARYLTAAPSYHRARALEIIAAHDLKEAEEARERQARWAAQRAEWKAAQEAKA